MSSNIGLIAFISRQYLQPSFIAIVQLRFIFILAHVSLNSTTYLDLVLF